MGTENQAQWKEVSKERPCAICGKPGWCAYLADGATSICRRENNGSAKVKVDQTGVEYFVYDSEIDGAAADEPQVGIVTLRIRHLVYDQFLRRLSLASDHASSLQKRGLSLPTIQQHRFKSIIPHDFNRATKELYEKYGDDLFRVPGFFPTDAGAAVNLTDNGILIPVRDLDGSIISIKIRKDGTQFGNRYISLSSKKKNGPGASATVHVPLNKFQRPVSCVWATEGELKCEVATEKLKTLCISMPGVAAWRQIFPVAEQLGAKEIIIALDRDMETKPQVARSAAAFTAAALARVRLVKIAVWDNAHKGIDDALQAGAKIDFLEGDQIKPYFDGLLEKHGLPKTDWSNPSHSGSGAAAVGGDYRDDNWTQPLPLPSPTPIAPTLPLDLIPTAFRAWIVDEADRMQGHLDYFVAAVIVAISSLLGRKLVVRPKKLDNWAVVPNLWGALIGRPTTKKSPVQSKAFEFVNELANEAAKEFAEQELDWKADHAVLLGRKKGLEEKIKEAGKKENTAANIGAYRDELREIEREIEESRPRAKRYFTNDATTEKIAEIVRDNPNGIAVIRDELYGFLKSNEKPGREGDRAFFLESWNGSGSYTVDRIGRGTIHIKALRLSIFGGIQPSRLGEYIREAVQGGAGDDGLLQRFQVMVWPEHATDWQYVDRVPDAEARERARKVFRSIAEAGPTDFNANAGNGEEGIPWIGFTEDAQLLFREWLTQLENRLCKDESLTPALGSHLGKYRSLMPSLALIFHVVDVLDSGNVGSGISLEATKMAAAYCEYLEQHARKVYVSVENLPIKLGHLLLEHIENRRVRDGMSLRDIYRHHWEELKDEESVVLALNTLEEFGWARRQEIRATGGAPSTVIRIHPSLRK